MGSTADFSEPAQECVCVASGAGGMPLLRIEDEADGPPTNQHDAPALFERIRRGRRRAPSERVQVVQELKRYENGGEYIAQDLTRDGRRLDKRRWPAVLREEVT